MGLGSNRTAWKRQTRYFGHEHSSTYSSLVFDNRGIGFSDTPGVRYSTSEMAKDAVDLLTHLGWLDLSSSPTRDLNVIGVSMGGMIAQEFGLLVPDRLSSLILVSTASRLVRTVPFIENLRQRINMFIPRDMDVQLVEIAHRLLSDGFLALPDTEHPSVNFPTNYERFAANELQKRKDKDGFTRKGFILQAIAAGWHHKDATQVKQLADKVGRQRIFLMHGTADRMIAFPHAETLHEELGEGIQYRAWPGRGHVLMWEEEKAFDEEIQTFVEKCSRLPS